jgi:hypothetical protein
MWTSLCTVHKEYCASARNEFVRSRTTAAAKRSQGIGSPLPGPWAMYRGKPTPDSKADE